MSRPDIFKELLSKWLETDALSEASQEISTKMVAVESSNLAAVGYDASNQWLEIAFLDGSVYRFYGVSDEVHTELMEAPSHGSYFYWNIRDSYSHDRIVG